MARDPRDSIWRSQDLARDILERRCGLYDRDEYAIAKGNIDKLAGTRLPIETITGRRSLLRAKGLSRRFFPGGQPPPAFIRWSRMPNPCCSHAMNPTPTSGKFKMSLALTVRRSGGASRRRIDSQSRMHPGCSVEDGRPRGWSREAARGDRIGNFSMATTARDQSECTRQTASMD